MDIYFQECVGKWLEECLGRTVAADREERGFRFVEESLELAQAAGISKEQALELVDYVYSRPVGELPQEVGGVMITLHALCYAFNLVVESCAHTELAHIQENMENIRAKHAAKKIRGPLPGDYPA